MSQDWYLNLSLLEMIRPALFVWIYIQFLNKGWGTNYNIIGLHPDSKAEQPRIRPP